MSDNITNDEIIFADETDQLSFQKEETEQEKKIDDNWKILIVDDDKEIHSVTKMVLSNFVFNNKGLDFISAYSSKQAEELLATYNDISVILLDVVMETDDAGLRLVKYIRESIKNKLVRIILRTGQPGQAPEEKVIIDYDINDYKAKTELTAQKLFTTVMASIRSYNDLMTIENNRRGLEKIIEASSSIFELQSMRKFASGVLEQLTSLLNLNKNALYCQNSGFALTNSNEGELLIIAGSGEYEKFINRKINEVIPKHIIDDINLAKQQRKSLFFENHYVGYFITKSGIENIVYMEGWKKLNDWDKNLIEVFCSNVAIAYDNITLNQEIEDTQREIIYKLGEIVETRSKETGNHVKRVAEYAKLLALKYGLDENEAEIIKLASPMHDIGKLGIPDNILNKPGELTKEEYQIIQSHPLIGYEMLKGSNRVIIKASAIIALQHHEKYNGEGYPNKLKGEEIHIYGRIISIVDVFDALSSDRVYKKALPLDYVFEYLEREKGISFDPVLIDIFLKNKEEFIAIKNKYL